MSDEITVDQSTESDPGKETIMEMEVTSENKTAEQEDEVVRSGLEDYGNKQPFLKKGYLRNQIQKSAHCLRYFRCI